MRTDTFDSFTVETTDNGSSTVRTKEDEMPVTFNEPVQITRNKRPWTELYPKAVQYVDQVLDAFDKVAKGKNDEFARSVNGIDIPLDRDSENADLRAVRLLNERSAGRGNKVHAAMRQGKIHLINAPKPVVKRTRKPKEDNETSDNGTAE